MDVEEASSYNEDVARSKRRLPPAQPPIPSDPEAARQLHLEGDEGQQGRRF